LPPFPPRFILEIDICKRLSGVIAHDNTRGLFLNATRRRKAAGEKPREKYRYDLSGQKTLESLKALDVNFGQSPE
jgi:hypothetical protein